MRRSRLWDLGVRLGPTPTGPYNAITDVAGVEVGQVTVYSGRAGYCLRGRVRREPG